MTPFDGLNDFVTGEAYLESEAELNYTETAGYVGPDRRRIAPIGRRVEDAARYWPWAWLMPTLALVGLLVSWGVALGTARSTLSRKVDKTTQAGVDLRQDLDRGDLREKINAQSENFKLVVLKLDSANLRLRQIVCRGKEESCR